MDRYESCTTSIVEFNNQLADQLGDNFKELNAGVNNLLEWQDQYKETILETQGYSKELIDQLGNATENINNITEKLRFWRKNQFQRKYNFWS